MTRFQTQPLEQVAVLFSGGTPRKSDDALWRGDVPWLTPKDMGNWTGTTEQTVSASAIGNGTRLAPENSCYVAVRGMSLHNEIRIVRSSRPLTFNQDIKAIAPRNGVDPTFLYYSLVAQRPQLLEWVTSAGHGTGVLETDRLKSLLIPVIPRSEQSRIAGVFASLDDKIELNRRMNETLEAMAQAMFRDWFMDFGPTRRKLEGATDPLTIMGGLVKEAERAKALADLFPATLGDDGLPEEWTKTSLGSAFNVQIGRTPPRKEHHHFVEHGAGVPWMSIRDMGEAGVFIYETAEAIAQESATLHRVPLIEEGTVVVSFKLTVGRVAITEQPMLSNEAIAQLGRLDPAQKPWFPYLWMKSYDYSRLGSTSSIATAVNSKSIRGIDYLVPAKNIGLQFEAIVDPLFERIRCASKENRTLAATRDLLLPKLISGEVRLSAASGAAA